MARPDIKEFSMYAHEAYLTRKNFVLAILILRLPKAVKVKILRHSYNLCELQYTLEIDNTVLPCVDTDLEQFCGQSKEC